MSRNGEGITPQSHTLQPMIHPEINSPTINNTFISNNAMAHPSPMNMRAGSVLGSVYSQMTPVHGTASKLISFH
jgi:hypothetical protein